MIETSRTEFSSYAIAAVLPMLDVTSVIHRDEPALSSEQASGFSGRRLSFVTLVLSMSFDNGIDDTSHEVPLTWRGGAVKAPFWRIPQPETHQLGPARITLPIAAFRLSLQQALA